MGYLVSLIPVAQELVCSRCIYVGCYTRDVILGLIVGRNEMQRETFGNQRAESQIWKSKMRTAIFRVLCNLVFGRIY